jgi:hypothetical protein
MIPRSLYLPPFRIWLRRRRQRGRTDDPESSREREQQEWRLFWDVACGRISGGTYCPAINEPIPKPNPPQTERISPASAVDELTMTVKYTGLVSVSNKKRHTYIWYI